MPRYIKQGDKTYRVKPSARKLNIDSLNRAQQLASNPLNKLRFVHPRSKRTEIIEHIKNMQPKQEETK